MKSATNQLPRPCLGCRLPFTPKRRKRDGSWPVVCPRCAPAALGRLRRGRPQPACLKAASSARTRARRERYEARLKVYFGGIDNREAEIYALGVSDGYQRGYNVAAAYYLGLGKRRRSA